MLNLSSDLKIYAYTRPTDMRKGFNGLSGIVRSEFQSDPTDGSLFVFINRRRDRMKLLHFDGGGYWLYYRLLAFHALHGPHVSVLKTNRVCPLPRRPCRF